MIPKVAPWKKDTVSSLVDKVNAGGTLAIIDIHGVPADTMINMRADLRDKMAIQVAKKRLMKLAWENAAENSVNWTLCLKVQSNQHLYRLNHSTPSNSLQS